MGLQNDLPAPVPQRWERPLNVAPGHWKQQLAAKYRDIASRGDVGALRQLLEAHPEFLNKRGSHNRTLLWEATRNGRMEAVQWLVERGAEVDATGCYNSETHVQVTPYCAAVYYKRADIAAYLHAKGAQQDIFRAAFLGNQSQVARELDTDPALLDAEDPYDPIYYIPLLAFGVAGGHGALTEFLLRRGARVAPYSALLLHLAARAARMDLVKLLVAHGAQVHAVDSGIFVAVSDLHIMRYLLSQGASPTQPGKNGFTPLLYMTRGDKRESPEKVALLLEYGASIDAVDPQGKSALHYAAAAGHTRVLAVLLEHGASVTLQDHQGEAALSLARAAGKSAAVDLLARWTAHP